MRRNTLIAIVVSSSIVVLGLVGIVAALLLQASRLGERVESVDETQETTAAQAAAERSPWADREAEAVRAVTRLRVGEQTVLERLQEGRIESHVDLVRDLAAAGTAQWVGSQIEDSSLYTVSWRWRVGSASVGPRWIVQLNPDGPEALSGGRVVPANALAELVHLDDPASWGRFLNRRDEVIRALTNHQFEGGLRLGSTLLVHFARGERDFDAFARETLGWTVIPERIDPDGPLLYLVHLQWRDGEELHDAQWMVNLADSSFQPRNLLAYTLMQATARVTPRQIDAMQMPRVDGAPMDLSTPPAGERSEPRRALRWVLHDPRVAEAVAVLLGFRRSGHDVVDRGWRVDPAEEVGWWDVRYVFLQDGEERSLDWRVDARSGTVQPVSDIARIASYFLGLDSGVSP